MEKRMADWTAARVKRTEELKANDPRTPVWARLREVEDKREAIYQTTFGRPIWDTSNAEKSKVFHLTEPLREESVKLYREIDKLANEIRKTSAEQKELDRLKTVPKTPQREKWRKFISDELHRFV